MKILDRSAYLIESFIRWRTLVFFLIFLNLSLILFTNQVVLRDFKNSADEYSYFLQAKIFSTGRLSVPSPENRHFFDIDEVINDGKFYSKYPPGWPFFLMFGMMVSKAMLVNLIFGLLTLVALYRLAKHLFSEDVARIALLLVSCNAFFIFNSASYFTHPSTLFFLTLAMYIYLKNLRTTNPGPWFLLGMVIGIAFNTRPYTTFVIAIPFAFYELWLLVIKREKPLKEIVGQWGASIVGFSLFLALFLLYNHLQTGHLMRVPFSVYNIDETIGFGGRYAQSASWSFLNNILRRCLVLNLWMPLFPVFALIALYKIPHPHKTRAYLLLLVFFSLLVGYYFYPYSVKDQYGPRYLYSSSSAIFMLMAAGIDKLSKKKRSFVLMALLFFSIAFFANRCLYFNKQVNERMLVYDRVKRDDISNAIVFLKRSLGGMPAGHLVRNGISFNGPVIYVRDLNGKNKILMRGYPERDYYRWVEIDGEYRLKKIANNS